MFGKGVLDKEECNITSTDKINIHSLMLLCFVFFSTFKNKKEEKEEGREEGGREGEIGRRRKRGRGREERKRREDVKEGKKKHLKIFQTRLKNLEGEI